MLIKGEIPILLYFLGKETLFDKFLLLHSFLFIVFSLNPKLAAYWGKVVVEHYGECLANAVTPINQTVSLAFVQDFEYLGWHQHSWTVDNPLTPFILSCLHNSSLIVDLSINLNSLVESSQNGLSILSLGVEVECVMFDL